MMTGKAATSLIKPPGLFENPIVWIGLAAALVILMKR
jgi:hypothetical protein